MGDEEKEIKELLDETWRTCYKFLRIRAARVFGADHYNQPSDGRRW